jgi:hypothetical protein
MVETDVCVTNFPIRGSSKLLMLGSIEDVSVQEACVYVENEK